PRARLEVKADREPGVLGGRPQPVPSRVADVDREDIENRAAVAHSRTPLELSGGGLGRVAGQEREHAQPVGGDGVELLDRPVVPGVEAGRGVYRGHRAVDLSAAIICSTWLNGGPAVVPPSTGNTTPVTCAERSLAR